VTTLSALALSYNSAGAAGIGSELYIEWNKLKSFVPTSRAAGWGAGLPKPTGMPFSQLAIAAWT